LNNQSLILPLHDISALPVASAPDGRKKPRVMVLVDWYAPGFKAGGPIRSVVNYAAQLEQVQDIFILTADRDLHDDAPYEGIPADKWLVNNKHRVFYASPATLNWHQIRRRIDEVKPDYIYLNGMYSRSLTVFPLLMNRFGLLDAKIVLAPRGMLLKSALENKSIKKKLWLTFARVIGLSNGIVFHATDETEISDIRKFFGKSKPVFIAGNMPGKQKPFEPLSSKERGSLKMVFVGRIHPIKNLEFLLSALQKVIGNVELTIIAILENKPYWERCRASIARLPSSIKVSVLKNIPHHQIEDIIRSNHLFVLPTRGENFGHSIFESLASGRPVIISDQTPWRNLEEQRAGLDLPLENDLLFASGIQSFIDMDERVHTSWCEGAWNLAHKYLENSELRQTYVNQFSLERRKLMIFVDWFEPGYKAGGPIQSCKNMSLALYKDMDIYLVCSDRDLNDREPYVGIRLNTWTIYEQKIQVFYCRKGDMGIHRIMDLLKSIRPDYLYVNGVFSMNYSILPILAGKLRKVSTIVAPRGMLQHGSLRFKQKKKKIFLSFVKSLGLYEDAIFHATDNQEQKDINEHFPVNKGINVMENFFQANTLPVFHTSKQCGSLKLVFLSRISPKKNIDFIIRILATLPDHCRASLTIAGEIEDQGYWERCQQLIRNLPEHVRVDYRGAIPNRLLPEFYKEFHIFVLPTHGENFGHAILEAMLCSKPVIISDRTPWQNLDKFKSGYALPLDDMSRFTRVVEEFAMMMQDEYNTWVDGAYQFAEEKQKRNLDLKKKYLSLFA
jgi:glycosyltransferase involved in cell wall biosynthesis